MKQGIEDLIRMINRCMSNEYYYTNHPKYKKPMYFVFDILFGLKEHNIDDDQYGIGEIGMRIMLEKYRDNLSVLIGEEDSQDEIDDFLNQYGDN